MADTGSEKKATRSRLLSTREACFLIAFFTVGYLFMYSGIVAHNPKALIHPVLGHLGWIIGGLSPLIAGVSYHLLAKRSGMRRLLCGLIAVAIFFLSQMAGLYLVGYAMPHPE